MQIKVTTRHGHLSQEHQETIRAKVDKLVHLFPRIMMIEVLVDVADEEKVVEIQVSAEHKHDFVASERNKEMMAAVDLCMHKLEQQIRRYKEKIQNHHRGENNK